MDPDGSFSLFVLQREGASVICPVCARNKENVEYWKVYEEYVMNRCY